MKVVDEPSIGLIYFSIREMVESRVRYWLLHFARRGEPIEVVRTAVNH